MGTKFIIRKATEQDIPTLRELIRRSVRELQANDYTPEQLECALETVYGVDSQLISDGTYFAVIVSQQSKDVIVGCGGWSKRKTLYGGDVWTGREDTLLDPKSEGAKIRAFFVHPEWARNGIGSLILDACEEAAKAAGFTRLEMGATLTGVPFYAAKGYASVEPMDVPMRGGLKLPIMKMVKQT